ncbi:flagellar export protein FliJ [Mitsuaria sp. WAJ17]|uniref:flagellar export protein FliJ n=1 Tax=Mitsuaria sp. WAJ17 TaxID=2761452 RepID=UPI00160431D2|nr:flagellar export protein FliJ [Mitsuaria sp. WAJ17]MBB2486536.1 flagellar export protein FliJ [Mitsuaria sp. WAJ17]
MSAQSLQALDVLLERAEAERDEALGLLRDAEARAGALRQQHEQLAQYRTEYRTRWTQSFARSTTVEILSCYQSFGGRLDQAISQQDLLSCQAEQRLALIREQLRERELRVASVRKLLERRRQEARRSQERQEQKATDEQAARALRHAAFGAALRLGH